MGALYERWCGFYGVRRDRGDMLRRFVGFKDKARRVHVQQVRQAVHLGLNVSGDATAEEFAEFQRPRSKCSRRV